LGKGPVLAETLGKIQFSELFKGCGWAGGDGLEPAFSNVSSNVIRLSLRFAFPRD